MEKTTVLTKLDFRTLKYANLFILKYKRRTSIWFLVTALISAAVIVYDVLFVKDSYAFTIIGVLFILYSGYNYFNLEKRLDNQLSRYFYGRRDIHTQKVEVTDEKLVIIRSVDPENPIEYDWSFVTEILEMPQFYILMIGKGVPIIVDRSDEALLEGTKENLDAIIKEKAALKPYKRTEEDIVKRPITFVHPVYTEEEMSNIQEVENEVVNEDENVEEVTTEVQSEEVEEVNEPTEE
jgi:hypothetical protein